MGKQPIMNYLYNTWREHRTRTCGFLLLTPQNSTLLSIKDSEGRFDTKNPPPTQVPLLGPQPLEIGLLPQAQQPHAEIRSKELAQMR